MGQQQLLLVILGIIVVGIAIAVGIAQFGGNSTSANKDGVTASLVDLAANAYQFRIRPSTLGGGSGSYLNYLLPPKLTSDDNGDYRIAAVSASLITLQGKSKLNTLWVAECTSDDTGHTTLSYTGW